MTVQALSSFWIFPLHRPCQNDFVTVLYLADFYFQERSEGKGFKGSALLDWIPQLG